MEKKLVIEFGNNKIVAEIDDNNLPEIPPELRVWVEDNNGNFIQDICLVREHYSYNRNDYTFDWNCESIDCLVWGNPNTEDFSDDFTIGVREEDDE